MKFLIVCALLPMALCLPSFRTAEEKWKADVEFLAQKFASSDLTRKACEDECHKYMDEDKEINMAFACPLACAGLQKELERLVSAHSESKRALLGGHLHLPHFNISSLLDLEKLKAEVQLIVDMVGSDASEQACESGCHHLLQQGHVFNYGCPLACRGLQLAIHTLHIKRDPTTVATPVST